MTMEDKYLIKVGSLELYEETEAYVSEDCYGVCVRAWAYDKDGNIYDVHYCAEDAIAERGEDWSLEDIDYDHPTMIIDDYGYIIDEVL